MSNLILTHGPAQVEVSPLGAQVLSWRVGATRVLYEGSSPKRSGIPLLFPFADPLENDTLVHTGTQLPQHGFGRNVAWQLEQITSTQARATLRASNLPETWRKKFPYAFATTLNITLDANTLRYEWHVENLDTKPIPIAPGLHPYFPLLHPRKGSLRTTPTLDLSPLATDEELSTGIKYPYTDLTTYFPNYILSIRCHPQPELLVAWTQPPTKPDTDFVCLEPFMRGTNGINKNPIWIEPEANWTWEVEFKVDLNK